MSLFKKIAMWLGIFVGSGLSFLVGLYFITSMLTSGLKAPIEKQLAAIRMEDAALAYSYTTRGFQSQTSLEAFKKIINDYSGLRNNDSISFDEREVSSDGVGIVKATLKSRGGSITSIHYRLIKENDQWKIEGMVINPQEDTGQFKETAPPPRAAVSSNEPSKPVSLTNYYQQPRYKFSINYPASWSYVESAGRIVSFIGAKGTPSGQSSLAAQYLARRQPVDQVISEGRNDLVRVSESFKVEDDGMLPSQVISNRHYQARYVLYSYVLNSVPTKRMEIVYYKNVNRAQYMIDYISTADQFYVDLPTAKAMVASFTIP